MKEYGLAFSVPSQVMILQEVCLLRGLNRHKDALELLSRAGYVGEATATTGSVHSLDGRLRQLALTITHGTLTFLHRCVIFNVFIVNHEALLCLHRA